MFSGQDRLKCIINKVILYTIKQHSPIPRNLVGVVKSALSSFSFCFHIQVFLINNYYSGSCAD